MTLDLTRTNPFSSIKMSPKNYIVKSLMGIRKNNDYLLLTQSVELHGRKKYTEPKIDNNYDCPSLIFCNFLSSDLVSNFKNF